MYNECIKEENLDYVIGLGGLVFIERRGFSPKNSHPFNRSHMPLINPQKFRGPGGLDFDFRIGPLKFGK